jgi:hypothetical protein
MKTRCSRESNSTHLFHRRDDNLSDLTSSRGRAGYETKFFGERFADDIVLSAEATVIREDDVGVLGRDDIESKTHDEPGDRGYKAVVLREFCLIRLVCFERRSRAISHQRVITGED